MRPVRASSTTKPASEQVQILSPAGVLLGEILLPGAVNFAFAGSTLYITTDNAIWAAELSAKGA